MSNIRQTKKLNNQRIHMSDYDAIRNLIASYGQSIDSRPRDPDFIASHYIDNCSFTDNGVTLTGRKQIRSLLDAAKTMDAQQPELSGTRHLQMNSLINIDNDKALATTQVVVLELNAEQGWRIRGCGIYTDNIELDGEGEWKFKSKEVTWFTSAGPDPLNPALAGLYKDFFESIKYEG
ncbi:nuclear transport factor 2 family protein [Colwellia sp. 20A7]|uniref:nuclear transport factor 2 family protein n=1 Tax=Colwellia sp. 20A7 TaxID=2689569 RepID=UPI001356EB86|nr:nuclear transport factor 2 family protein [Colwellia sp. 20A7]